MITGTCGSRQSFSVQKYVNTACLLELIIVCKYLK
jgi:hypothetical protein